MHDATTPPQQPVTLQDIADRCGVALSTVSLALRGRPNVRPKTMQRILDVAREMGYDPDQFQMARRLAMKKHGAAPLNHAIAVFFPPIIFRMPYFAEIYHGIMEAAQAEQFDVLTVDSSRLSDDAGVFTFSPIIRRGEIDGAILCRVIRSTDLMTALREQAGFGQRPICAPFEEYRGCLSVRADDQQGAYQATDHLLTLGHRHIGLFVYKDDKRISPVKDRRIAGAMQAYRAHELDPAGFLHTFNTPVSWMDPVTVPHRQQTRMGANAGELDARAQFQAFLAAHAALTAVIGLNDASALHAWYACAALGLRVPEDFSLIGFDNTDTMPGTQGDNLLTSVHVPLFEIGFHTAQRLIHHIQHPEEPTDTLVLPTTLIQRASTAPAR